MSKIVSLRKSYNNSQQVLHMLNTRYGLNDLGIKRLLDVSTVRINELKKKETQLNKVEIEVLLTLFPELEGRL